MHKGRLPPARHWRKPPIAFRKAKGRSASAIRPTTKARIPARGPTISDQPRLPAQGFGRITQPMIRFFDMADHARLPWRFTRESRSVLARLS
jgi:hypothetical protein